MKKKILSQLLILSFAFAGLFLVGNNVFGGDPSVIITDPGDDPGAGGITCHQFAEPGRINVCWEREQGWNIPINKWCTFTGSMKDKCFI